MTKEKFIPDGVLAYADELRALRRHLHAHPELGFHETATADLVAAQLSAWGYEVHRGIGKTGVVGCLRVGSSPRRLGLRADMDALPIVEAGDLPYASRNAGAMHACGHDGHTAMLLGAARYLAENIERVDFDGSVCFIFQPAEEAEGGAAVMIADGLFEQFPVDAVYGLHNWPGIPVGEMAVMPGPVMAGTCGFEIRVQGRGCHAAMPHQGVDTLVAASHLVLALQTIVARNVHPCESAVVSVTQIHGGEAWNVVPDDAVLRGTLRTFKPHVQALVESSIERLCAGVASTFGAQIGVVFDSRYPATVNSVAETELCARAAARVVGPALVRRDELPSMGAEDFAFMLQVKPGCYVWLGNGPGSGGCTLHNPHYDFNDDVLPLGVSYWVSVVETALATATAG